MTSSCPGQPVDGVVDSPGGVGEVSKGTLTSHSLPPCIACRFSPPRGVSFRAVSACFRLCPQHPQDLSTPGSVCEKEEDLTLRA